MYLYVAEKLHVRMSVGHCHTYLHALILGLGYSYFMLNTTENDAVIDACRVMLKMRRQLHIVYTYDDLLHSSKFCQLKSRG